MATSSTYAQSFPADDIITEAWERIGKIGDIITGDVARAAQRSLSLMLLDWSARPGLNLWQVQQLPITFAQGQATQDLDSSTIDVLEAWVTDRDGYDYILTRFGRTDYAELTSKADQGRPTQFYINRSIPAPSITLWPVPDDAYTVTLNRIRQPQDLSSIGQTLDVPMLYMEAVHAGLSARLAKKFAPDRYSLLKAEADEAYANAAAENRERAPMTIAPIGWGR